MAEAVTQGCHTRPRLWAYRTRCNITHLARSTKFWV